MATRVNASDFTKAAAKLKSAPAKVRRNFTKRLNEAGRPAMLKVVEEGSQDMPSGGGLARHLAEKGNARLTRTSTGIAAVLGRRGAYLAGPNSGLVRHPVWGHRNAWVSQAVPSGTYDAAFEAVEREVQAGVAKAWEDLTREL